MKQIQSEKKRLLVETEAQKLKALDENFKKKFEYWRSQLIPRKQVSRDYIINFCKLASRTLLVRDQELHCYSISNPWFEILWAHLPHRQSKYSRDGNGPTTVYEFLITHRLSFLLSNPRAESEQRAKQSKKREAKLSNFYFWCEASLRDFFFVKLRRCQRDLSTQKSSIY